MIAFYSIYGTIANMTEQRLSLISSSDWQDYELLDSGNLKKLERFGNFRFIRPEPQAMWKARLSPEKWKSDGVFLPSKGDYKAHELSGWRITSDLPESWQMQYQN